MDIRTDALRRHAATRHQEGAANATIRKELAGFRRAYNLAVQANRLTTRPHFPSVKGNDTREGFLTMVDVDAICAEIRPYPGAAGGVLRAALPPLQRLLEKQRDHTRAVEKEQQKVVPWVFHRDGKKILSVRGPGTGRARERAWTGPGSTTSGEPPCETSREPACPGRSR